VCPISIAVTVSEMSFSCKIPGIFDTACLWCIPQKYVWSSASSWSWDLYPKQMCGTLLTSRRHIFAFLITFPCEDTFSEETKI
jgi:hypothetical protein